MEAGEGQGPANCGVTLPDDELDVIEGKREELVGRLQTKYGYSKEKVEQEADSWVQKL